jgi:hypothetical protein
MKTYHWIANSFAAPFFSDTESGFIEAPDATDALEKVRRKYKHPAGLFALIIETCETKPKMVARYMSGPAVTQNLCDMSDGKGGYWKDGKKLEPQKEHVETWKERDKHGR